MTKKIDNIINHVLQEIKPNPSEIKDIKKRVDDFTKKINDNIKKQKINAVVFIGGSFAKGTLIKKQKYDIDIFIRFDKDYKKEDISRITENILNNIKKPERVKGSREYFRVYKKDNLFFEIVPVIKVNKPEEAENTTDLSYFHVRYIKNKIKDKNIKDQIMIAKAFCQYNKCYGAESHIKGFSGYALELLVYYYGNFEKFLKGILKTKEQKIIDIQNLHKTKRNILMDLNESKLLSPIILIDPTYKQRNSLAALSNETLKDFQEIARDFLENPSLDYFKKRKIDFSNIKEKTKKSKKDFIFLEAETKKQEGAIAGSKLLKFYSLLNKEIEKEFVIKSKGFEYNEDKKASFYFVVKPLKEKVIEGPYLQDKENLKRFKEKHKKVFEKNKKVYAKEETEKDVQNFIKNWKKKNSELIKDMSVSSLRIKDKIQ